MPVEPSSTFVQQVSAWYTSIPPLSEAACHKCVRQITELGQDLVPFDAAKMGSLGILFFDQPSPQLFNFLDQNSRQGLIRIMAVSLANNTLDIATTWEILQHGASDVVSWQENPAVSAQMVGARLVRWKAIDEVLATPLMRNNLIGTSAAWTQTLRQIVEVARYTDTSVLVTGESGTGKELVARLIHTLDPRPHKNKLIVLDCTTVAPELSGSEFFGHERGAFTGAMNARDGAFMLADSGTLFLDEVGELPLTLQAELLRVVQEHSYKRVGSNQWRETDFRLICATNRNLLQEEAQGNFRRDFYYRIATWTCHLPPLRERVEDIIPLAQYFLAQLLPGGETPELDDVVRDYLLQRAYPGNVRDLRQLMTRIARRHVGPGPITAGDIPEAERPTGNFASMGWHDQRFDQAIQRAVLLKVGLKEIGRVAEEVAEQFALTEAEGNLQRAAQALGITDRALQMRRAQRRQNGAGQHLATP